MGVDGEPVEVQTIHPPQDYSLAQIQHACAMAYFMNRGKLVLLEPPANEPPLTGP